jgi:hypothetical protein
LAEETEIPGENYRPAGSHWQPLSQNVLYGTPCLSGILRTRNLSGDRY